MTKQSRETMNERLQALLKKSPDDLKKQHVQFELEPPSQIETEEQILDALFHGDWQQEPVKEEVASRPWWLSWWGGPLLLTPAIAGVVALFWVFQSPNVVKPPPRALNPKGHTRQVSKQQISMYLGVWSPVTRKIRRMGDNDKCLSKESVLFSFSVRKTPGFLSIWIQNSKGQVKQFYPAKDKQARLWRVGRWNLESNGYALPYLLKKEEGRVTFAVLKTPQPPTAKQTKQLSQNKDLRKALQQLAASSASKQVYWDVASLVVKK